MSLNQKDKQYLYDLLAQGFIAAVESYHLGKFERKILAQKILKAVEGAATIEEILVFLEPIIKIYPVFGNIQKIIKGRKTQEKEKAIIKKLEQYLTANPV